MFWMASAIMMNELRAAPNGGAERGVRKQRRLRKVIETIPGAVLDRRLPAGLSAEGFFEGEHRSG